MPRRPHDAFASPLEQYMRAARLRAVDVASAAGVSVNVVQKLRRCDPAELARFPLHSLCAVALSLGCAPAELIPWLTSSPREGLLWERGIRRRTPLKPAAPPPDTRPID